MEASKIDSFIMANSKFLPQDKIPVIREKLQAAADDRYMTISSVQLKDPTTLLVVSILLGELGVDRFMLGETGMGVLKLLTFGGCGILWIIDMCTISKKVKEANFNELAKYL